VFTYSGRSGEAYLTYSRVSAERFTYFCCPLTIRGHDIEHPRGYTGLFSELSERER
jgi:hypothetical protein